MKTRLNFLSLARVVLLAALPLFYLQTARASVFQDLLNDSKKKILNQEAQKKQSEPLVLPRRDHEMATNRKNGYTAPQKTTDTPQTEVSAPNPAPSNKTKIVKCKPNSIADVCTEDSKKPPANNIVQAREFGLMMSCRYSIAGHLYCD